MSFLPRPARGSKECPLPYRLAWHPPMPILAFHNVSLQGIIIHRGADYPSQETTNQRGGQGGRHQKGYAHADAGVGQRNHHLGQVQAAARQQQADKRQGQGTMPAGLLLSTGSARRFAGYRMGQGFLPADLPGNGPELPSPANHAKMGAPNRARPKKGWPPAEPPFALHTHGMIMPALHFLTTSEACTCTVAAGKGAWAGRRPAPSTRESFPAPANRSAQNILPRRR